MTELAMVTGAFGYTGRRISMKLLEQGAKVRTLTAHPERRDVSTDDIEPFPFAFDDPDELMKSLEGVDVLFNTYWVRFDRGATTFDRAVRNTLILFEAARRAGVRRIVHVSITNAELGKSLPYFEGKAVLEASLIGSGIPHAIVRPTVMFGRGDVFINNMAWLLRRFPMFPIPGSGEYCLQPVHVDDVADLCVKVSGVEHDVLVDAARPETFTFRGLLETIKQATGNSCRLAHASPAVALGLSRIVGRLLGDVLLTRDELDGLMRELIVSNADVQCPTSLTAWLHEHASCVGRRYASEIARNYLPGSRQTVHAT
jgi:uncharacterized protein YbjT (DUF2867 family)